MLPKSMMQLKNPVALSLFDPDDKNFETFTGNSKSTSRLAFGGVLDPKHLALSSDFDGMSGSVRRSKDNFQLNYDVSGRISGR
jgi:hypothetical protein